VSKGVETAAGRPPCGRATPETAILLRGVTGGLGGFHVDSGDVRRSWVASGGRGWPRGVTSGLGVVGLLMASRVSGGLVGSRVKL
jgi:hypothetical protein